MLKFTFPMPPPTNGVYQAVYSSRIKRTVFFMTYKGKKWKAEAQKQILLQVDDLIEEPVEVQVRWYFKHKRDIDGGLKLLLDTLQKTVVVNDSQIEALHIFKYTDKENPRVEIEIKKYVLEN